MSAQETSFEALAASPGDYAVDSEWIGDSPPALTTDFIQSPQMRHLPSQESHPGFHGFDSCVARIAGPGKLVAASNPLLKSDPNAQPAVASSPDSLLSSFNDSSSSDHSSKLTSMTALSSVAGTTSAKRGRRRSKGSVRSSAADASALETENTATPRSLGATAAHTKQVSAMDNAVGDVPMADNWSFQDYLRLDDDLTDNGDDGHDRSMSPLATSLTGNNTPGTVDPKSIQRTPHVAGAGAGGAPTLSPYSASLYFVSASSSPHPEDASQEFLSPEQTHASGFDAASTSPWQDSPVQQKKRHSKAASQYSLNQSMNDLKTSASREASPGSNFVFSQGPSPKSFSRNTQSPVDTSGFNFGYFPGDATDPMQIAPGFMFPDTNPNGPTAAWTNNGFEQQQQQHQQQMFSSNTPGQTPLFQTLPAMPAPYMRPPRPLNFFVGVTPQKSRVETQIPVTIFLSALPPGVTKLHLPPHTISKPKLLAKTPVERSPSMLELHTMVVCTSAMRDETNRRKALDRAAAAEHAPRSALSFDGSATEEGDDNRPANGGEIWICKGCIQRERKRANRKKSKKPEDDEQWSREEHRRIIIFNTNEIKEWQRPTPAALSSLDENSAGSPIEAVISVPMRITCYCRHHGEKAGFQVIFTLKDFRGLPIAQTVSRSIMITDDHKTPTALSGGSASANASAAPSIAGDRSASPPASKSLAGASRPSAPGASQSTSDLKTLKRGSAIFSAGAQQAEADGPGGATAANSGAAAADAMPGPPSPDGTRGHSSKKRKSSGGVQKVPNGLVMTRIETSPQSQGPPQTSTASSRNGASTSPVANFASASSFLSPQTGGGFAPDTMAAAVDMALMNGGSGDPDIDNLAGTMALTADLKAAGPLTPNSHTDQIGNMANSNRTGSLDNLAALSQNPMFSAPASTHPSRPPSPNGLRNSMQMFQQQFFHHQQQQQHQHQLQQQMNQAQFAQQFPANVFSLPMSMTHAAAAAAAAAAVAAVPNPISQPVIHKIIPAEGPKSGGIEVTVLGSAFYQGLDVMFGDQRATTTTFWGESSLVCLVPPSSMAGHVHVTLRQANPRAASQPFTAPQQQRITFKYLDDDEQQLLRAALTVLSRKMTGKIEDAQDVARRIIGSETASWGVSGNTSSGGSSGGNTRGAGGLSASLLAGAGGQGFETHLLKVLELIDLDDSSNQTRLNMQRRTTGHSMLHLACVLGMHRFVAGLLARGANPDVRDNGGYTPLHLAALNNQPEIVRRLIHAGADPTMRTLSGLTASEVTTSRDVLRAIKRFERHTRSRSGGSLHSRTSSAASLRSLWEPMAMSTLPRRVSGSAAIEATTGNDSTDESADASSHAEVDSSSYAASSDDEDDENARNSSEQEEDDEWLDMRSSEGAARSRGGSMSMLPLSRRSTREASPDRRAAVASGSTVKGLRTAGAAAAATDDVPAALASPAAAAVTALKDQLSAHFQQLVSQIPPMPNNPLPDYYHAYLNSTAFQRISSFVPNIGGTVGSRPNSPGGPSGGGGGGAGGASSGKEFEGRWWDLTSLMASSAPPPAYEEIFPNKKSTDLDTKVATAAGAAAEAEADTKCAALYDRSRTQQQPVEEEETEGEEAVVEADAQESRRTGRIPALLQIGRKHQITKEQQENFRRAHKEKRKGLGSDTFLYTVWIPLLLGVLLLWLSGARAWFIPSVSFSVPYPTSLGHPARPTGTGDAATGPCAKSDTRQCGPEPVLPLPPAVTAVPDGDDGGHDGGDGGHGLLQDLLGGRVGVAV